MAGTSKANLRQTATNAAAELVSAFVGAKLVKTTAEALEQFTAVREEVYTDLEKFPTAASGGGGGGYKKKASDPGTVELNYGKFKGQTIAAVYDMDVAAAGEFGYDKSGRDYVKWLAGNDANKFLQSRATAFLESKRASSAEDTSAAAAVVADDAYDWS